MLIYIYVCMYVCNTYCGCLVWIKSILCEPQEETEQNISCK